MTTTMAVVAPSSSSLSSRTFGFSASPFVGLRGVLFHEEFGPRRRSRTVSARALNFVASKLTRLRVQNTLSVSPKPQSSMIVGLSRVQRRRVRGDHPRATYEEDENGLPEDAITDGPILEPEYYSYNDPNTGEPAPTYGIRTPLPDRLFWAEDMVDITRSTQAAAPFETSRIDLNEPSEKRKRSGGRRRKNDSSPPSEEQLARAKEEEAENEALLQRMKEKFSADDKDSETEMIKYGYSDDDGEEDEEEEEEDEKKFFNMPEKKEGETTLALATTDKVDDLTESNTPLANDELWWNWRKPPPDQKPWSAWQKRAGDCDSVMAAAMAETGQIELFGEKPTIAEATLARARKRVFYAERMEAEEARKKEIGAMAYYKEWVKGWDEDSTKEAVQRRFEETGEEEGFQLLDMFSHQTRAEYRQMQGTDIRIRRDPLTMRMREDQIKQVWGGDPVYPTINYEQDPDEIADYRNANMHEPIPDIVEMLRESGRLITQEEVKRLQDLEKAQELEFAEDDMLSGAVDIGDEEEENDDDDDEEDEEAEGEQTQVVNVAAKSSELKDNEPAKEAVITLDEEDVSSVEVLDDGEDESEESEESDDVV